LAALGSPLELSTLVSPGPTLQRDYRLRCLLRAFCPPQSETLSALEAIRSQYPPVLLNRLWELWGAVWIASGLRRLGFTGRMTTKDTQVFRSCHWRLQKEGITIELDYEPDPILVEHSRLPAAHERMMPALEWAAKHQALSPERPFLAMETRSSPDYILRVTTPRERVLLVGDACLASPEHHGRGEEKLGAKPYTVEHYRRTIGWSLDGAMVRCHPMGAFVLFPAPAHKWSTFEQLPGVRDCTILCASPKDHAVATDRLRHLLSAVTNEPISEAIAS
jgi:hypothetical protein